MQILVISLLTLSPVRFWVLEEHERRMKVTHEG